MNKKLSLTLLIIFVANAVFVPQDPFQLKKISFVLFVIINYRTFLVLDKYALRVIFYGGAITTLTILASIVLTGEIYENIKLGYMGCLLLAAIPIKVEDFNFEKIFVMTLVCLAFVIVVFASLDFLGLIPLEVNSFLTWFRESGNAMIGKGEHLPIYICYFFKASPLLLIAFAVLAENKKWVLSVIAFVALILSGTRANIGCATVVAAFLLWTGIKDRNIKFLLLMLIALLLIGIVVEGSFIASIHDVFERKESSDAVRTGIYVSIIEGFRENPMSLLIGSGFCSEFFNSGRGETAWNAELSYLNLLRQVGLIFFVLMMCMYLYPVYKLIKLKKRINVVFSYFAYLVVAYTNPLLYTSTGMLACLTMWCICANEEKIYDVISGILIERKS